MNTFSTIFMTIMHAFSALIGIFGCTAAFKAYIRAEKARRVAKKTGNWEDADALNHDALGVTILFAFLTILPILFGVAITRLLPALVSCLESLLV